MKKIFNSAKNKTLETTEEEVCMWGNIIMVYEMISNLRLIFHKTYEKDKRFSD